MQPMQNVLTPITTIYQTQLEASRQLADAVFSGTEKIDHVVLEATHRAFSEQLRFAQSLAAVRDPQGMASAQNTFLTQRPERAMDYQRELIHIFTEMQNEIGRSMRTYMEQFGSSAVSGSANTIDAVENQANEVFNPITGMFSLWESAFREMASVANKNMHAARDSFESAASEAYDKATETAEDVVEATMPGRERKSGNGSASKRK